MDVKARKSAKLLFSEFSTDLKKNAENIPLYLPNYVQLKRSEVIF